MCVSYLEPAAARRCQEFSTAQPHTSPAVRRGCLGSGWAAQPITEPQIWQGLISDGLKVVFLSSLHLIACLPRNIRVVNSY